MLKVKWVYFIGMLVFGLSFASCSKQDVTPNNDTVQEPEWDTKGTNDGRGFETPVPDSEEGEITDPNNDTDGLSKKH